LLPAGLDVAALRSLRSAHRQALGEPRQLARFLCGISSPALTRAKLSRHALNGALEEWGFVEVLRWCESLAAG
jgi:ATP-dependent DNA helicase RecQ